MHLGYADEGLLWYGVIHTRMGQMPIRDFNSYDPLRYLWCAGWSFIFGDGIIGLRRSEWLFQAICFIFGLLALQRVLRTTRQLVFFSVLLLFWQVWGLRYFDSCYPMLAVFFAVRLSEKQSFQRCFQAGVFAGFSVLMGLNHALYALTAFFFLMVYCFSRGVLEKPFNKFLIFFAGIFVGCLPTFGMMLFIPNYWESYVGRFFQGVHQVGTLSMDNRNLIPWPWLLRSEKILKQGLTPCIGALRDWNLAAQGFSFVTVLVFYGFAFIGILRAKKDILYKNPLLVGSVFVGLPYLNHIFCRSDILHLGETAFPLISGLLAFSWSIYWIQKIMVGWILFLTLFGALPLGNLFFKITCPVGATAPYLIGKDKIWLICGQGRVLDQFKALVKENVPENETIFFAPAMPMLYCLTNKTSPTYQIYFWGLDTPQMQQRTVRELRDNKVNWAVVADVDFDNREDLRFSNRYAVVCNYLKENFDVLPANLPAGYVFLRRKNMVESSQ